MQALAQRLADTCRPPATIGLDGTLGSGKTQFVRFFAEALGVSAEDVTSPTYVLLQRYTGTQVVYHFDFYRLEREEQVWDLGIDELEAQPVYVIAEWASKFPGCLADDRVMIRFELSEQQREATISSTGPASDSVVELLTQSE